jgi:CHASE2 domain-containing sensor protein
MAISIDTTYLVLLIVTLAFTILALSKEDKQARMPIEIISVICWFVSGLIQFIGGGLNDLVSIGLTSLYIGIGIIMTLFIIKDASELKEERVYSFREG